MRCLVFDGSGGKGGFCDYISLQIAGRLRSRGWVVDQFSYSSLKPELCTGCGRCREGVCCIDDGFTSVMNEMSEADLVVFVSPIRFSGLSSQMKVFVDRFNPLWYNHKDVRARFCAVLVGGSDSPKFSNAESELKALAKGCGMGWCGVLELGGSDRASVGTYDASVVVFIDEVVGKTR